MKESFYFRTIQPIFDPENDLKYHNFIVILTLNSTTSFSIIELRMYIPVVARSSVLGMT